jgi:cytochrome c oxidase assembly factor CtaG
MTITVEPLQLAPVLVAGALYARRAATLRDTTRAVSPARQASFYTGLLLTALSVLLLGELADELFWAHMAEHLLLADVAALLMVLGLTGPMLAPLLRLGTLGTLRTLAHPFVALPLWALNLYLWHLPVLHEAAVRHDAVHALQHLGFLAFGANVWMCLFGPLPAPAWFGTPARAGYIVAVRLVSAVLANVLLFGGDSFYDVYAAGEAAHSISPAADQNAAGAIMMVEESILTICLFGWLFLRAARESEERQELLDLAARRGVELDPRRAQRAIAAGRQDQLRRRIESSSSGES